MAGYPDHPGSGISPHELLAGGLRRGRREQHVDQTLGTATGASPIVSARHSSFPRAWSPNEARWEPRRGVIPELLLDRTAGWKPVRPMLIINWCGHSQQFIPWREADDYWRLVPIWVSLSSTGLLR
jgi:hypothetical protein